MNKILIAGNKIYQRCSYCNKLVQLNKWLVGSVHICLTEKEIEKKYYDTVKDYE